ncbi:MAG: hypothetical protein ABIA93_02285 [Candidatus Woesearchaeota archaeon]
MAERLNGPKDVTRFVAGTVVYFKESGFGHQSDFYDAGIILDVNTPAAIRGAVNRALIEAVNEIRTSPQMEDIRRMSDQYGGVEEWDREAMTASYDPQTGISSVQIPVPENGKIAERFAHTLETLLNEHANFVIRDRG